MSKGRLEAFSDGVLAILITIMVPDRHIERELAAAEDPHHDERAWPGHRVG